MGAGTIIVNILIGLLILGTLACFAGAGYLMVQSANIQVGAIVQTSFTGNVAFLTSALIGPKGEYSSSVTMQEALNMLYCDVPGSAGAYSSWYRPAGQNSLYDPYTQASYTAFWNTSYTCNVDDDCNAKPWLECGMISNCWKGGSYSGQAAWSADVAASCCGSPSNDPTPQYNAEGSFTGPYMVCSFTSEDATTSGVCSLTNEINGQPPFSCNTNTHRCIPSNATASGVTECASDADCSSVVAGACNTLSGFCDSDLGEHVLINTPWLAEGTVSSINSDGSVNVQWMRIKNLYPFKGPQLSWFPPNTPWDYTQCVFISPLDTTASLSADEMNFDVTLMALGYASKSLDPMGLPTLSSTFTTGPNVWAEVGPNGYGWMGSQTSGQTVSGLPLLSEVGASYSAWNLQAMSLSKNTLKRIPNYTIQNTKATDFNTALVKSMSEFRCDYMVDRPPHLQLASGTCIP